MDRRGRGSNERLVNLGECAMLGKVFGKSHARSQYDIETVEPLALFFTSIDPPDDATIYRCRLRVSRERVSTCPHPPRAALLRVVARPRANVAVS